MGAIRTRCNFGLKDVAPPSSDSSFFVYTQQSGKDDVLDHLEKLLGGPESILKPVTTIHAKTFLTAIFGLVYRFVHVHFVFVGVGKKGSINLSVD